MIIDHKQKNIDFCGNETNSTYEINVIHFI